MKTKTIKGLCSNCEQITTLHVQDEELVVNIRKEPVKVKVQYVRCTKCGDETVDSKLNVDALEPAYREYRKKHGFLQPEELRNWRKRHGITQGQLARLLGIGTATLSRYENGALQEEAHDRLLRLAMDPSNLEKLIQESGNIFDAARKTKLIKLLRDSQVDICSVDTPNKEPATISEPSMTYVATEATAMRTQLPCHHFESQLGDGKRPAWTPRARRGSPEALLEATKATPRLTDEDVDELVQAIGHRSESRFKNPLL